MLEFFGELREFFSENDPEHTATRRRIAAAVGGLFILILIVVGLEVVWRVPQWEVRSSLTNSKLSEDRVKQLELEDDFRKTLAQIVLGVGSIFILYFTWRRARAGDATVRIMEQGHITDRFTKAIEQLGRVDSDRPNIEVRLGAIYALERIAIDSPRDHWNIVEVLTAYVRQNAPTLPDVAYVAGAKPRTDIQAVLTVLGRRRTVSKRERPNQNMDLSLSRLSEANLVSANLQRATLSEANLQEARFYLADLQAAELFKANLQGASLSNANLRGASLRVANLQGASLSVADLQGAKPLKADLQGASLVDADLRDAQGLEIDQIKSATGWETARYSEPIRGGLGLPP